jgi:starvation-inducible outer membrane lipoprotein
MTNRALRFIFAADVFLAAFFLAGCESTMPQGIQQARLTAAQNIQAEAPGE